MSSKDGIIVRPGDGCCYTYESFGSGLRKSLWKDLSSWTT